MVFYRLCRLPILRRCGKLIFKHSAPRGSNPAGGNEKGETKMKQKLSGRDYTYVASMLFGMFFGAGNLIFPVHMGQMAGANVWPAVIGFCVTGVGLPLLGVAALGISRSGGLFELGSRVGKPYSMFFTCLLYLTIGPFFAIPRCATTSFTVGLEQVLPQGGNMRLCLLAVLRRPSSPRRCSFRSARARSSSGSARCSTPASCCSSAFWSSWRCSRPGAVRRRGRTGWAAYASTAFLHRLPRGLQHHGRAGKPCLRHRGRAGHPWPRRDRARTPWRAALSARVFSAVC